MIKRTILELATLFLDNFTQKKNIKFLKTIFKNEIQTFFDIGCHKGETIDIFQKHFKINKIFAFDINKDALDGIDKTKYLNTTFFNFGVAEKSYNTKVKFNQFSPINSLNKFDDKSSYTNLKKIIIKVLNFPNKVHEDKFCEVKIISMDEFCEKNAISEIDVVKIDIEGGEYSALKGFQNTITKAKIIIFEHHYDNSLIKNYNFSDINQLLITNNFVEVCKNKLLFRNIYDYIYINKKFLDQNVSN